MSSKSCKLTEKGWNEVGDFSDISGTFKFFHISKLAKTRFWIGKEPPEDGIIGHFFIPGNPMDIPISSEDQLFVFGVAEISWFKVN